MSHHEAEGRSATPPETGGRLSRRTALFCFVALFAMNLLDYMDRNILSAVLPDVRPSLDIDAGQAGRLPMYFLVTFSIFGVLMGYAGDRFRRTYLLAAGVAVWSIATVGSGLARSFEHLALARSFLGVGEATYGVIAPTILLDLFPRKQRGRAMSAFYLAMPIGSALGLAVGGVVAKHYGWQTPSSSSASPASSPPSEPSSCPSPVAAHPRMSRPSSSKPRPTVGWDDYRDLLVNSSYTYTVFGMTAYTFAIGGLVYWFPSYLISVRGIPGDRANLMLGAITLCAAILGMLSGGVLADKLSVKDPRALFLVPGFAMLAALPFIVLTLFATEPWLVFPACSWPRRCSSSIPAPATRSSATSSPPSCGPPPTPPRSSVSIFWVISGRPGSSAGSPSTPAALTRWPPLWGASSGPSARSPSSPKAGPGPKISPPASWS